MLDSDNYEDLKCMANVVLSIWDLKNGRNCNIGTDGQNQEMNSDGMKITIMELSCCLMKEEVSNLLFIHCMYMKS